MTRQERRSSDHNIQIKKLQYELEMMKAQFASGGGMGVGNSNAIPASGQSPLVNTFMMPKPQGLNVISQTWLSNFWIVDWDRSAWRFACDQAIRQGWPINYSILIQWAYQSSAFIRSLYKQQEDYIASMEIYLEDLKGNKIEELSTLICDTIWFKELKKKICTAPMEGFRGLNIDPIGNKVFEYSMQDLDPINRMLRQGTFNFSDGLYFDKNVNLLFIQPSTNEKEFLGYMQTITRDFIDINLNDTNWVQAGKRLAFPIIMMGYPMNGASNDPNDPSGQAKDNWWRAQAENAISTLDPSNGFVYPYTRNAKGEVEKSFEFEIGNSVSRGGAHNIYKDFDDVHENKTREWLFGSILTSTAGKGGSYKLGDIHKDKYLIAMKALLEYTIAELNSDFLQNKLPSFYKGFPVGKCRFAINKSRQFEVDEIVALAPAMKQSGLGFSAKFYEKLGFAEEDIMVVPTTPTATKLNPENMGTIKLATEKEGLFSSLKKKVVL